MRRNFGALMENNGGEEGRRKSYVEGRRRAAEIFEEGERNLAFIKKNDFLFPFFSHKAMPLVPF